MKEFSGSVCSEINQVNKVRNLDGWKRHNYLLGTIRPSWPVPSQKTKSFFGGIEKIMVCAITLTGARWKLTKRNRAWRLVYIDIGQNRMINE